jgi:hypothetical protein
MGDIPDEVYPIWGYGAGPTPVFPLIPVNPIEEPSVRLKVIPSVVGLYRIVKIPIPTGPSGPVTYAPVFPVAPVAPVGPTPPVAVMIRVFILLDP